VRRRALLAGALAAAAARAEAPAPILLLRHAMAPGGGDPPGFRLDDLLQATEKEAIKRGDQFIASEMFLLALADSKGEPAIWPSQWPDAQEPGSRHRGRARRPEAWTAPRPKASARR
jgi:hypothetical protein